MEWGKRKMISAALGPYWGGKWDTNQSINTWCVNVARGFAKPGTKCLGSAALQ